MGVNHTIASNFWSFASDDTSCRSVAHTSFSLLPVICSWLRLVLELALGSVIFGTTIDPARDFIGGAGVAAGFGEAAAIVIRWYPLQ